MRLLFGHDEAVGKFVADWDAPETPVWKPGFCGIGVLREDDALVAGFIFDDWHPEQKRIELSARAVDPRVFGPRLIRALGAYPFGKLDCFRVWARTSVENHRCRKILKGIGFTEESTQAHWYGQGKHAVTARVTRSEWERRWGSALKFAA